MKEAQVKSGKRAGVLIKVVDKLKALEHEVRELRQANEILRKAYTYFAQAELEDPPTHGGVAMPVGSTCEARETTNPCDADAVGVRARCVHIGYAAAMRAPWIGSLMHA